MYVRTLGERLALDTCYWSTGSSARSSLAVVSAKQARESDVIASHRTRLFQFQLV
jgi:hypothetical protein